MAQLPPKVPLNIPRQSQFLSQSQHQQTHWHDDVLSDPPPTLSPRDLNFQQNNSALMEEFMEFSATKRSAHRRSISDSITFVMDDFRGPEEEGRGGSDGVLVADDAGKSNHHHHHEFERFDDEQFMSMFNNDIASGMLAAGPANSSSNPTSDLDRNSINEDKRVQQEEEKVAKSEHEEVDSSCKTTDKESGQPQAGVAAATEACAAVAANATAPGNNETIIDPKRVKRILANRQSAQRSRVRKLQYISELERSVTSLQTEVAMLSPRVAFLDHQRMLLNVDNSALKAKIAALAQDKIFKDAHQEALKREIERLRQVYYQQTLKKAEYSVTPTSLSPPQSAAAQPPTCNIQVNEKEQLIS